MQNPSIFRTLGILKTLAHSKPEAYSDIYDKAFCENNWRKIVPQYKFAALSTSRNIYHEVVTPERVILFLFKNRVIFLFKKKQTNKLKTIVRKGAGDCEILIYLLIYLNKLAYLQLITVLLCGNSSPKSHEQDYLKTFGKDFEKNTWTKMNSFLGIL